VPFDVENELLKINQCILYLKSLVELKEKACAVDCTDLVLLQLAAKDQLIALSLSEMVPLDTLESFQKRCSNKEFFECLVLEIKRHGSNMQRILSRHKRIKVDALNTKLDHLKLDYTVNSNEILRVEKVLQVLLDDDLRERMLEYKIFECLNAEKATPLLVSLAKRSGKRDSLENIKNKDGMEFDNS
jgi:hypothetical protein